MATPAPSLLETVLHSSIPQPFLLRAPALSDLQPIKAMFSEPSNIEFDESARRSPATDEGMTGAINAMRAGAAHTPPTKSNFLIISTAPETDGELIGITGLGLIKNLPEPEWPTGAVGGTDGFYKIGNVGVMINPKWRGKGVATEAVRLSIVFGFTQMDMQEVTMGTLEINKKMVKVMKRLGWEGKVVVDEKGAREIVYGMKKEEWENLVDNQNV